MPQEMSVAELEQIHVNRAKKVTEKASENLHVLSNEPSLAMYRLQEHVRKSMVTMVAKRYDAQRMKERLLGTCYDIENAVQVLDGMNKAVPHLQSIHERFKRMMFLKQQIEFERTRKCVREAQRQRHQQQQQYRQASVESVESSASTSSEMRKSKSAFAVGGGGRTPSQDMGGKGKHPKTEETRTGSFSTSGSKDGGGDGASQSSTPTSGADSHVSEDLAEQLSPLPVHHG